MGSLGDREQTYGPPQHVSSVLAVPLCRTNITTQSIAHPIHLHGHDFWILAQESTPWDGMTDSFRTINPPRRDTAVLPAQGYLAIAFRLDNPGAWLLHCHIAWHASQGLALEFIESEESISMQSKDMGVFQDTCKSWDEWYGNATYDRDGSGI